LIFISCGSSSGDFAVAVAVVDVILYVRPELLTYLPQLRKFLFKIFLLLNG
jgi:hypothetical protein